MQQDIINKLLCLCLNKSWHPIGEKTVRDAFVQISGSGIDSKDGNPTDLALDIDYELDNDGNPIFSKQTLININPVSWDVWCTLPVRKWDLYVNTPNKKIRVPTVIISTEFEKMPVKKYKKTPTKQGIWERDGGIDQYTGKNLKKEDASMDHVVPKSRGGNPNSWENVVLCHRDINSKKGNKLNNEIGLKLIKNPIAPKSIPLYKLIQTAKHSDWQLFIKK